MQKLRLNVDWSAENLSVCVFIPNPEWADKNDVKILNGIETIAGWGGEQIFTK